MDIKTKLKLVAPILFTRIKLSKRIAKKIRKDQTDTPKYPAQWKNDYVLKKSKKFAKIFKVDLEVIGYDQLPKAPAILAPNHSSTFDPALILMALENPSKTSDDVNPKSVFLAKNELKDNKMANGYMEILNTFFISRTNPRDAIKTIDEFATFAKEEKRYAVVFPSGTRDKDGKVGEFKGGAFKAAKQHFLPIVPVTINNSLSITDTSRIDSIKVQVIFGKAIKPMTVIAQSTKDIAIKIQKEVTRNWVAPQGKRSKNEDKLA